MMEFECIILHGIQSGDLCRIFLHLGVVVSDPEVVDTDARKFEVS